MIGETILKWLKDNDAVLVLDSRKKFEYIVEQLYAPVDDKELKTREFVDIEVLGMTVVFVEGGVAKLYDEYLKLLRENRR